jgi:hypothetical protein
LTEQVDPFDTHVKCRGETRQRVRDTVCDLARLTCDTGSLIIRLAYVLTPNKEEATMMMMEMSDDDQMSNENEMSNDDKAPSKRDECET